MLYSGGQRCGKYLVHIVPRRVFFARLVRSGKKNREKIYTKPYYYNIIVILYVVCVARVKDQMLLLYYLIQYNNVQQRLVQTLFSGGGGVQARFMIRENYACLSNHSCGVSRKINLQRQQRRTRRRR